MSRSTNAIWTGPYLRRPLKVCLSTKTCQKNHKVMPHILKHKYK